MTTAQLHLRSAKLLMMLPVALVGCTGTPGVVFDQTEAASAWPPPPDQPRLRYVGQIKTAGDLKPGLGVGESIGEFLFGKEEALGMVSPMGVCTNGGDEVYIADSAAQLVHVFNLKNRKYQRWTPKPPLPAFAQPVAIAYDTAGRRVLVSDPAAGVIFAFNQRGECTGTLGDGILRRPCGVAVHPTTGVIAVADVDAHQIVFLASTGADHARLGSRGTDPGRFNFPTYVAYDGAGRLYVSDSLNFRVQAFAPDHAFLRSIGTKGDMPGYFSQPKGLAVDAEDHLYVVDANFEAVQVFSTEGQLLMTFGREGKGPGEFWLPAGIATDPSGRVWVADSYNRRVQVFQYLGAGWGLGGTP
ncbi:MAG TPA: 6-bladed beta-propeller [Phycisphaerales bacterium]|nr:6-bladed beta-propeller [Phycisphaerales bacterium]